jgi:uncharacterized protein
MKLQAMPPSLDEVRDRVRPICRRHSVARLEAFGSLAAGKAHAGSDADFMVEFLPGVSAGLFEMGALREDLESALGCPVDLLSRQAVERSRNPYRRSGILESPVTVYGGA